MRCIVVDDEPLARKGMQLLISQVPFLRLEGMFGSVLAADEFLRENPVDVIFLDIQMPGMTGMEYLQSASPAAKVIITTAYPQFAVDAFAMDVTDYLVKPVRLERFLKAVKKAERSVSVVHEPEEEYIFIRTERKYIRAHYSDIDFIEGLKDYVIVHCGSERHMVASNLKTIHSALPPHLFLRVNKSFVVNVSKIRSVDHEWVVIQSRHLPLGENYRKGVMDFISGRKLFRG
jgi:two-component system, LytTR family, response regulator